MNNLQIIIGAAIILIGVYVILLGINPKKAGDENSKISLGNPKIKAELLERSNQLIDKLQKSSFSEYSNKYSNEAKRLKIDMEKYLGIQCNSNVKIRDYERTVNQFSFEKITDDLYSLQNQLKSE